MSKNITKHLKEQPQSEALLEFDSEFHMNSRVGLQQCVPLTKKIHTIYGLNYEHEVLQNWESYKVTLMHKQKTNCTVINWIWPEYWHEPKNKSPNIIWSYSSNYGITHSCICELLHILISVAPSTGSLKRSFSKLSKIYHNDRN